MSVFSTELKQLRKKAGMTQPELAKRLGVSRSTISMYELESREPDFEKLERIADIFNVHPSDIMGWDKGTPLSIAGNDPRFDKLLILYNGLNSEGKEKLVNYADDLVSSGKYSGVD